MQANQVQHGFIDDDLKWYEDKDPKGVTALIWEQSWEEFPYRVNLSETESGALLCKEHFRTFEAARDYCLKMTNNMVA